MSKPLFKKAAFCFGLLFFLLLILFYSLTKAQEVSQDKVAQKVEYTSQNLGDPFQSIFEREEKQVKPKPKPAKTSLPELEVQGMVWGSAQPQAIINNRVVKIGEKIGGVEILDIREEGVYVLFEEETHILRPKIRGRKKGERETE